MITIHLSFSIESVDFFILPISYMEEAMVEGGVLFAPGTAKLFDEIGNSEDLKEKAKDFLRLGESVRKAHSAGHPNKSPSSTENACVSAEALIDGMSKKHTPRERFFGENITDAVDTIKRFLNR